MKNEAISGKISRMLGSLKYTAYNAKKASPEEKEDRGYNFHIRLPMKFKKGFYIYIYWNFQPLRKQCLLWLSITL